MINTKNRSFIMQKWVITTKAPNQRTKHLIEVFDEAELYKSLVSLVSNPNPNEIKSTIKPNNMNTLNDETNKP